MMCDLQQNTPEWLAFRRSKIGASDAPIIMQVNPWTTPLQLWERKLGLVPEQEKTQQMLRGSDLESTALRCFNEKTGFTLQPKVVVSRCYEWMMASLDGFDEIGNAVEIKCPGREDHELALKGKIPQKYYPQLQHQMFVAGLESMFYASYDENSLTYRVVCADKEYQMKMFEMEVEFYQCMREFTPPTMTERDYQIKNDSYYINLCEQYKNVKKELNKLQNYEKDIRQTLLKAAGECNTVGGGLKITKSVRRGHVDYSIIPELQGIDLDIFRADPVVSWRITDTGDENE